MKRISTLLLLSASAAGVKVVEDVEVSITCQNEYKLAETEFYPADNATKALQDLAYKTCMPEMSNLPNSQKIFLCTFDAIFQFVTLRRLVKTEEVTVWLEKKEDQRIIDEEIEQTVADIVKRQESKIDRTKLLNKRAETYCATLQTRFDTHIDTMHEISHLKNPKARGHSYEDECLEILEFNEPIFMPRHPVISSLTLPDEESLPFLFSPLELCQVYHKLHKKLANRQRRLMYQTPEGSNDGSHAQDLENDFVKLSLIASYEIYLTKQRELLQQNCFDEVLLRDSAKEYCDNSLSKKLDLSLWTDQQQQRACYELMQPIHTICENLATNGDRPAECKPCQDLVAPLFSKYEAFVESAIVSIIQQVAESDNQSLTEAKA